MDEDEKKARDEAREEKRRQRDAKREEKKKKREEYRACENAFGAKEKDLTRIKMKLWGNTRMTRESKDAYDKYLNIINKAENRCRTYSEIGLSVEDIENELLPFATKDKDIEAQIKAEKEESKRLKNLKERNKKDVIALKKTLWGKYSLSPDSKRRVQRILDETEAHEERYTTDEISDIRETLKEFAERDIDKAKAEYDAKHYKVVREESTDDEGNTITTERKERKTFCERHPEACKVGESLKKGAKATGESIKKGAVAIKDGTLATGGALIKGGEALGKGTMKAVDYLSGNASSEDDDEDGLGDEPKGSPKKIKRGYGDEENDVRPPKSKHTKKKYYEDDEEEDFEPSHGSRSKNKKVRRSYENDEDDDEGDAPLAFSSTGSKKRSRKQNQCKGECPTPRKKNTSKDYSVPYVFAEDPAPRRSTSNEDVSFGMPALFEDDPKPKRSRKGTSTGASMPSVFAEDPTPRRKKAVGGTQYSMPSAFADDPAPRKRTGKKTGSAKKTTRTVKTTKKATTKKKSTAKKPAPKKKKKNQGGNDWLTGGDAGLF